MACVFETLGLAGLVAVLTLTLLGAFKKNYKLVIKVTSAVAGFVTGMYKKYQCFLNVTCINTGISGN